MSSLLAFPTASANVAETPWSDNIWITPENAYSDNGVTANVISPAFDSPDQTYVLKLYTFDFSSIPDGSTIDGIICRVNAWYRSGQGSGSLDLLQLLDTSLAKVGTNQCSTPVALTTDDTTIITKGSNTDLWGNALTSAWVKNSNFGVAVGMLATAANADVDVDYVTLEVFYTEPSSDDLVAKDILAGIPIVDKPTIGQTHVLVSKDITSGIPVVDKPTIGQTHILVSKDIVTTAPIVDKPTLAQSGAPFFSDTFTEPTTNTLLQSHTPDVGTSWTLLWDSGQGGLFTVNATTDRCGANTAINHGSIYTADATYPSANYEVEFTVIGLGGATDRPMYAFVRIQDQENMYAVRMTSISNGCQLYKKVSGTWTALGSTFTLTTGVVTLGINGTTLYVKDDGTEVQSVEVSDISAAGKAGLGVGGGAELVTSTDLSNNINVIDDLTVTEVTSTGDNLVAKDILAGIPVVDKPTIGQTHVLVSKDITSGIPVVDKPTIGQTHVLVSKDITSGIPIVDKPVLSQTLPDELVAKDILAGIPVVDKPTIGQTHVLVSKDITSGIPVVDKPTIGQTHILVSKDITSGIPIVDKPILGQTLPDELVAKDILAGIPIVDKPSIGQTHVLVSKDITSGIPIVDKPTIGQTHVLVSKDVVSGIPIVDKPIISQNLPDELVAKDILAGIPVVDKPTIGQTHILVSKDITSGIPIVEKPTIGQTHVLVSKDITSGIPLVDKPTIGQTHILVSKDIVSGIPIVDKPVLWSFVPTPTHESRVYKALKENRSIKVKRQERKRNAAE